MSARGPEAKRARREALRQELQVRIDRGDLPLVEAVRMMRRIADKTQPEYAKLVGVSPRVLIDFERGAGNPTLRSLRKMLAPFGLDLSVRRRPSQNEPPLRPAVRRAVPRRPTR